MAITELTNPALADRAAEAAEQAARRACVWVRSLSQQDEIDAAEKLLSEIWGVGPEPVVPANLVKAMLHSGNYVSGAFADGSLVGTSLGFLGWKDGGLHLHSHITGVALSMQGRSVGFALKQHQRAWALANGLDEIVWTFDPLVRRNGYFNITKLGAEIVDYKPNFYGDMGDGINGHDDSDRCVVVWRAGSQRAMDAGEGRQLDPAVDPDRTKTVLTEDRGGGPGVTLREGPVLVAQIPYDIVRMRQEDHEKALAWRHALREVFEWAFSEDYVVTGMTRSGAYLLSRPAPS